MSIPQLTIEMEEDGTVFLEQEWCGDSDRIQLHPIHIRHLAELAGLLPARQRPLSAPGTERSARAQDMGDEELAHSYFAQP